MNPLLAIFQHSALSAFSKAGSETPGFVSTAEANGIGTAFIGLNRHCICPIQHHTVVDKGSTFITGKDRK
mgnify:CR=1 FL=1